ncbi:MAG: hypothetical protein ABIE07_08860 [Candidatus Zixiibacteriota bacterium]
MATGKQTKANKQNAQKSTGPKTEQGKRTASSNSLKHGLYAKDIIINTPHYKENKEEFEQLLGSLTGELQPKTALQDFMVLRIAVSIWRFRRSVRAETAEINDQLEGLDHKIKQRERYNRIIDVESTPKSRMRPQ